MKKNETSLRPPSRRDAGPAGRSVRDRGRRRRAPRFVAALLTCAVAMSPASADVPAPASGPGMEEPGFGFAPGGAAALASYFNGSPELLKSMRLSLETPEAAALVRLIAPLPAFRPDKLGEIPAAPPALRRHRARIERSVVRLARRHAALAGRLGSRKAETIPTSELARLRQEQRDLLAVARIFPGVDAAAVRDGREAVEAELARREAARTESARIAAARLRISAEDGDSPVEAGGGPSPKKPPVSLTKPRKTGGSAGGAPGGGGISGGDGRDSGAASRRPAGTKAARPLPGPREWRSPLESADDSFEHFVSHSRPGKPGADPVRLLTDFIDGYIADSSVSPRNKHLVLKYFEIGDDRVVEAIARAVRANIKTTILTDFNQCLVGKFAEGKNRTTDFESAGYKDGAPGRALRRLREELGFKLRWTEAGGERFVVLSGVPLFHSDPKKNTEHPLMHDKGAFAQGPDDKGYPLALVGTANMNQGEQVSRGPLPAYGGRYNAIQRIKDPVANLLDWWQVVNEIAAFNARAFKKIPREHNPQRIIYGDGSYREIAYTFGVQNPNDRITELFRRAADPANGIRVDEVIFSHFVLTETPEVEALRALMKAQEKFKVFGIFDQQFLWLDGWGEAGALADFQIQRPHGKTVFPFGAGLEHRMELYGYQRLVDAAEEIDLDAAPTQMHLWHDKTTIVKTTEIDPATKEAHQYTYVYTRSLNNSLHYENFESQDWYRFRRDSRGAREFEDGIKGVVKAEPRYAVPLHLAVVRAWLARMTDHAPYDLDLTRHAQAAVRILGRGDYAKVEALLGEIAGLPSRRSGRVDRAKILERARRFAGFLKWYYAEASRDHRLRKMGYREAVDVGVGLAGKSTRLKQVLRELFDDPKRPPAETSRLLRRAWREGLGLEEPPPRPRKPAGPPPGPRPPPPGGPSA